MSLPLSPKDCLEQHPDERSSADSTKPPSRPANQPNPRGRRWTKLSPGTSHLFSICPLRWPGTELCFPKKDTEPSNTHYEHQDGIPEPTTQTPPSTGSAPQPAKQLSLRVSEKLGLTPRQPTIPVKTFLSPDGKMAQEDQKTTRLSGWDQVAMRAYMRIALCFPFDNTAIDTATQHIEASLARLAKQRPDFAGTLEVHDGGIVHHRTCRNNKIPFFVEDISSEFPYVSYDELKAAKFPPAAFVHPRFIQPCPLTEGKPGVPVSTVRAFVIPGGLLLGIFFCHAFADGDCLRIFLETFAGQTRGEPVDGASTKNLNAPFANESNVKDNDGGRLDSLLERVPEYVVLDEPVGPTSPKFRMGGVPMESIAKIGKVFVFDNARLSQLRCTVLGASTAAMSNGNGHEYTNGYTNGNGDGLASGKAAYVHTLPSNYTCLAALTWAHIVRARLADTAKYMPYDQKIDNLALLQTMVNWKSRALTKANPGYFGNATAIAVTQLHTDDGILSGASSSQFDLAKLVFTIEKTISGVGDDFVRDRTELFSRVSDPRLVGLRFDPRTPQDLGFNTWRYFGADTEWTIPGVGCSAAMQPDVIRRLQDAWNMSGALILPAKANSTVHELLVTLPQTSMDLLCRDPDWMKWVDHVVG